MTNREHDSFTYDAETLRLLTEEQLLRLRNLHKQLDEQHEEIVECIARQLGCDPSTCRKDATMAIHNWAEGPEREMPPVEPSSLLTWLLWAHHGTIDQILALSDEIAA